MKTNKQTVGALGGVVRRLVPTVGALLLAAASAGVAAAPTFTTSYSNGAPGSIDVSVNAVDMTDLYSYQFSLSFDSGVLAATSVTEGTFLSLGGPTLFGSGTIDNSTGLISFVFGTMVGDISGVSGAGVLATISFDVLVPATTTISYSDVLAVNSQILEIPIAAPAAVLAVPEPSMALLSSVGLIGVLAAAFRRRKAACLFRP